MACWHAVQLILAFVLPCKVLALGGLVPRVWLSGTMCHMNVYIVSDFCSLLSMSGGMHVDAGGCGT